MIKVEKKRIGVSVNISGDIIDTIEELQAVLIAVRNALADAFDDENIANELIVLCGQLAFTEDVSVKAEILKEFNEKLEKQIKEEVG